MITIEVVTSLVDRPADGAAPDRPAVDEEVDEWSGPRVSFVTEPSGALVIFKTPSEVWAAYAPGHWVKVREVDA